MERVFSRFRLKPGFEAEYKRRHDDIWPEMTALLRQAGIRNYTIWNYGEDLFGYFETDDLDECVRIVSQSDVKKRWDDYMSDIIINDEDPTTTSGASKKPIFLFEG